MKFYKAPLSTYLVCPRLLELDKRHSFHCTYVQGPPCRHGDKCMRPHDHEKRLEDPEGHTTVHLVLSAMPIPLDHPDLSCDICGKALVYGDLEVPEIIEL